LVLKQFVTGENATRTIEWRKGVVVTIDQTKLPIKMVLLKLRTCRDVASAIKTMKIRGAPLIGAAAAYGLALTAYRSKTKKQEVLIKQLEASAELLRKTRPTGVNLFWAVNRVLEKTRNASDSVEKLVEVVISEAQKIADEDVQMNKKIGEYGSELLNNGDRVLTHCNAGSLATVDYGTALGVIRAAWEKGKKISVVATETRPKLQGARLTAYELKRDKIPFMLITDNMVGYVMSKGLVSKVVVGADRIVRDAVVNKIGTYTIAVLAHEHGIPFYAAAPSSTFDLEHTAQDVVIEQRNPEEVTNFGSETVAPKGVKVLNPAFDITPMKYVNGIICEKGVLSAEQLEKLAMTEYGILRGIKF
jgi:methylthioribose-1-phosphate isomerase